jgi:hypothetical protein
VVWILAPLIYLVMRDFFGIIAFGEKGDLILLGARTLEGLNLAVDSRQKKLVAAGPFPVA